MALSLHVNGEASVWTGTGDEEAIEELGVSVDGIEITINFYTEPIYVDTYGPKTPLDVQYFLQDADIKMQLVVYDNTVLNKVLTGVPGVSSLTATGGAWRAGDLMLANALATRLLIMSTPANTGLTSVEPCMNFLQAYPVDAGSVKLGTIKKVWNITWKALLSQQVSSSYGAVLWNAVCT